MKTQHVVQPYPVAATTISGDSIPSHLGFRPKVPFFFLQALRLRKGTAETPPGAVRVEMVQTLYRESEAQTEPFNADVLEPQDRALEIATLGFLSWRHGLPAGMHEVEMIERARQMRAWKKALPKPYDKATAGLGKIVVEAVDVNEWNFRENELEVLNQMRAGLAEKMMKKKQKRDQEVLEDRIQRYAASRFAERTARLQKLRSGLGRSMRKLVVKKRPKRRDIVQELDNRTSHWYGPQLRFGRNPGRGHEAINDDSRYLTTFSPLEIVLQKVDHVPPIVYPKLNDEQKSKPKSHAKEFCVRETRWSERYLQVLYDQLKENRLRGMRPVKSCRLKQAIPPSAARVETPGVESVSQWAEDCFQASLFLQKTIRGRAIQAVMFEGRVRCQELIEEVKSTHALQSHMQDVRGQHRRKVYGLQRGAELQRFRQKREREILQSLQGKSNADVLDFLTKELRRLENEREVHAFALLADRERHRREAAEGGRRQAEEQRRREHDEMLKQAMKVHQNSVDVYLENVILESKNWLAEREAREHIHEMAKKIDVAAQEAQALASDQEEEEIVAELLYNYALPEVEKKIVRQRLKERQSNYLKTCHDEVYKNMDALAQGPRMSEGKLLPLPRTVRHKVPPLIPVKILRLKRMRGTQSSSSFSLESHSLEVSNEESVTATRKTQQLPDP